MGVIAQALEDRDLELYVGTAVESVENRCEELGKTELEDVAWGFRGKYEWERLEEMPTVMH